MPYWLRLKDYEDDEILTAVCTISLPGRIWSLRTEYMNINDTNLIWEWNDSSWDRKNHPDERMSFMSALHQSNRNASLVISSHLWMKLTTWSLIDNYGLDRVPATQPEVIRTIFRLSAPTWCGSVIQRQQYSTATRTNRGWPISANQCEKSRSIEKTKLPMCN